MRLFMREDDALFASGVAWGRCWVCNLGAMRYEMQPDWIECDNCGHREGIY